MMTSLSPVSNGLWEKSFYPTRAPEKLVLSALPSWKSFEVAQASTTNTVTGTLQNVQQTTGTKAGDGDSTKTVQLTKFEGDAASSLTAVINGNRQGIEQDLAAKPPMAIHPLDWITLAEAYKLRGRVSYEKKDYQDAKDILEKLVGVNAGDVARFLKENASFNEAEARRAFYLGQISLAETYLALGDSGSAIKTLGKLDDFEKEVRVNLENFKKGGSKADEKKLAEVETEDLISRAQMVLVDALKDSARETNKEEDKKAKLQEAEGSLKKVVAHIEAGIKKAGEVKGVLTTGDSKQRLARSEKEFNKRQQMVPVSLIEIQLGLENYEGAIGEVRKLAKTGEKDPNPGVSQVQEKLKEVFKNERDLNDSLKRVIFAEVDALKAKALPAKDKKGFQEVITLLQGLQQAANLIRSNSEDHIRYYVSLAEAQLGAKDFKAAQEAIAKIKKDPQFIGEKDLQVITNVTNRLDYLARANEALIDSLKGQALPGEIAPIVLSEKQKVNLSKAQDILNSKNNDNLIKFFQDTKDARAMSLGKLTEKDIAEKAKLEKQIAEIEKHLKISQVSLAEVELGLKEYDEALKVADAVSIPADEQDLFRRLKDVKFWANFSKLGQNLDLLPSNKREYGVIVARVARATRDDAQDQAKGVVAFMGDSKTPYDRLLKLQPLIETFIKQSKDELAKEKDAKGTDIKTKSLKTLEAWFNLKTYMVYKDAKIDTLKIKVDESIDEDPRKPFDSLLYSILRYLAFKVKGQPIDKKIIGTIPDSDTIERTIKGITAKSEEEPLTATTITQKEAEKLINNYKNNFAKILEWMEAILTSQQINRSNNLRDKLNL